MPCDTIQRSTVKFLQKSTDLKLLQKAFEALGYQVRITGTGLAFTKWGMSGTYNKATGEVSARGSEEFDIDELKRQYSKATVNSQAKANGWEVSWTTNADGNEVANVQKAMF